MKNERLQLQANLSECSAILQHATLQCHPQLQTGANSIAYLLALSLMVRVLGAGWMGPWLMETIEAQCKHQKSELCGQSWSEVGS